jgi:glycosyltransferase involved in cell wall biosynthesis
MTVDRPMMLSILCLTYNHEAYVAQALDSFLQQETSFELEVVVADDCSTDATLSVVDQFRGQLGARLRVLTTPVNLACRGRYVALCEGDDYWCGKNKLQRQVEFLESHPDFVLAFHDARIVGVGSTAGQIQLPARLRRDAQAAELIETRSISTLTVCFRNVLDSLPPELDHAPVLDLCLWSLLGHHGNGKYLEYIEPAAYRVHEGGVHSTQSERTRYIMLSQSLLALARVYERSGDASLSGRLQLKATMMASRTLGWRAFLFLSLVAPVRWVLYKIGSVTRTWRPLLTTSATTRQE